MADGYVRQSAANIVDGQVINASDHNAEYNAIQAAFHATTGHNHDGTSAGGAKIVTNSITDAAVTTVKIADGNVTTAKLVDNAVTTAKITDANVTTAKVADNAVTNSKMADMAVNTIKGRVTTGTGDPEDLTVTQVRTLIGAGSGNGLDADTVDTYHASTSAGSNTIVVRNSTGRSQAYGYDVIGTDSTSSGVSTINLGSTSDSLDVQLQLNSGANTSLGGGRSFNVITNAGDVTFSFGRLSPAIGLRLKNGSGSNYVTIINNSTNPQISTNAGGIQIGSYTGLIVMQGVARGTTVTLTDGATITPDFLGGNYFVVTIAGNRTLANPTNLAVGQSGSITIKQDSTGSRTLSYGAYWKFPGGTVPTLTTTANAVDKLVYTVYSTTEIHATLIKDFK